MAASSQATPINQASGRSRVPKRVCREPGKTPVNSPTTGDMPPEP